MQNTIKTKTDNERLLLCEKLINSSSNLMFKFTLDHQKNMTINFVSKNLSTYFGKLIENNFSDGLSLLKQIICKEDLLILLSTGSQFLSNHRKNWKGQFRVFDKNNDMNWFSVNSEIEIIDNHWHFYGDIKNITPFKIQEDKLRFSEERYQFALDASSEGIWDYDVENNLVYFSSQSMKMIGYDEKEIIISREFWDQRIHPEDKDKYLQDFNEHISGNKPFYKNLQRILTKDNGYKYILSKGRVIERNENLIPKRIIGTHTDISAHREKEIQITKTIEILAEQNKRLNNFAHIVSHNLRSHASNFHMLLDIIDNETDPEITKDCFSHLKSNSIELSDTINNLKDLVEIQANLKPIKVPIKLRYYLNKVLNTLSQEIFKHDVEIYINIPEDTIVEFNPAYIESVLLNLTTNAIKYSREEINPKIEYTYIDNGKTKELHVKDNGLGIDLLKHGNSIFGMYKTFHKHPNARGIGLFISKNQIEAMGGSIVIDSIIGKGSTFKINFNE